MKSCFFLCKGLRFPARFKNQSPVTVLKLEVPDKLQLKHKTIRNSLEVKKWRDYAICLDQRNS